MLKISNELLAMSFLKKIFGEDKNTKELKKQIPWIPLTSLDQLENISKESHIKPVAIFKHSTRCGISRMVKKQFEKLLLPNKNNIKVYYLDLLKYRNVSDAVSEVFQVRHQSPQLLIIRNEVAVKHASHYDITTISINKYL